MRRWLTRMRVPLGFGLAGIVLWLAEPVWTSWTVGVVTAACGEAVRLWAAGHLEKSREVTASGPYRYLRHPLYFGSTLIAIGLAIAASHLGVAVLIGLYVGLTLSAARRSEEAHLREKFGDAYDAYVEKRAVPMVRRFSLARALRNREHHTIAGLVVGFLLLALKIAP
ncbi:MAG: isoprenylcysteine carboxylmethyltransferase family protein [Acidobacteriota bacterium]|nr:isoprenylcysteine carboxylmethyltransferase family protein [Acidobacteriota bacterium]